VLHYSKAGCCIITIAAYIVMMQSDTGGRNGTWCRDCSSAEHCYCEYEYKKFESKKVHQKGSENKKKNKL